MDSEDVYQMVGLIVGVISFFAIWVYSFITWGFLIGLAIGWLPALIGGMIFGILWPFFIIGIGYLILIS